MTDSTSRPSRRSTVMVVLAIVAAACSGGTAASEPSIAATTAVTPPSVTGTTPSPESSGPLLPAPNPATASVTLAEDAAVTATIGPEGGAIETVGSDGYRYVLTVPPGALFTDVEITLTPIADLTSEVVERFVAGAQFAPEGLTFAKAATLRIEGAPSDGVEALYYRGEGEDVALLPLVEPGSALTIPVLHFSGAGGGAPSPNAANRPPNQRTARVLRAATDEMLESGGECVPKGSEAWEAIKGELERSFREEIIPALLRATKNDEVLWDAMIAWIDWVLAGKSLEEYGLLCDEESQSADLVPPDVAAETLEGLGADLEELDLDPGEEVGGHWLANELLTIGLEYAIKNAGRLCAETNDLGEAKYVVAWAGAAVYASVLTEADDGTEWEARWQRLMAEELSRCYRFEFQFDSYIEVTDDPVLFTSTMQSTVTDLVAVANLALVGEEFESYWVRGPVTYVPHLEVRTAQGQCNFSMRNYWVDDLSVMLPSITPPDPKRKIKLPTIKPTTIEDDRITVVMERLNGSEYIDAGCGELGGPNLDGAWGPWAFNILHEDALQGILSPDSDPAFLFQLERGPGKLIGRLTFQRTLNMEGTEVYEETTMNLFHAPASRGD